MVPAMAKILVISGSARKESVNGKVAKVACGLAAEMGVEAEWIDPREHVLPLYDADLEEASGLPDAAKLLKAKFVAADALIFCSPEYNSSVTPLLKNLIDWVSRAESEDEPPLAAYQGKVAGLLSASPGGSVACGGWCTFGRFSGTSGFWSFQSSLRWAVPLGNSMRLAR